MQDFNLQNLTRTGLSLLSLAARKAKPFTAYRDENSAELDTLTPDSRAERDSASVLDIYAKQAKDPETDPYKRLKDYTTADGILTNLQNSTDTRNRRRLQNLLEGRRKSIKLHEITPLAEAVFKAFEAGLSGEPDADEFNYRLYQRTFVTSALVEQLDTSVKSYIGRTKGEGVALPDLAAGIIHSHHGAAYATVLRNARSSLDIGMFQFEHTTMVAELYMAMQQLKEQKGSLSVRLNVPGAITLQNALTMGALRKWLATDLKGLKADIGYDIRSERKGITAGAEDLIPKIAHEKFVLANKASDKLEEMMLILGSSNFTRGALGVFERDGMYANAMGNIEVDYLATYKGLVEKSDILGESRMERATFDKLMREARAAASFISAKGPKLRTSFGRDNSFIMSGDVYMRRMLSDMKTASEAMRAGGAISKATFIINVLQTKSESWKQLHRQIHEFAKAGGQVDLLLQGLEDYNEATGETIRGFGLDLPRLQEKLGLKLDAATKGSIYIADSVGRYVHGKAYFLDTPNGLIGYIGSANQSVRAVGSLYDEEEPDNLELGIRVTSNQDRGLKYQLDLLRAAHGVDVKLAPATLENLKRTEGRPDIWSTPIQARYAISEQSHRALASYTQQLRNEGLMLEMMARREYRDASDKFDINPDVQREAIGFKLGFKYGSAKIGHLVGFEAFAHETSAPLLNGKERHSLYLPHFHKIINGAMGFYRDEDGKLKQKWITPEEIIASALQATHNFVQKKLIGVEMRQRAITALRASNRRVTEAAIDQYIESRITGNFTQYGLKEKARTFLMNALGSFDSGELGKRFYNSKDYQYLAYELTDPEKPLNILENPADIAFRNGPLKTGEFNFMRPGDGYMQRRNRRNPVTGEPLVQVGKTYVGEAFKSLPIVSTSKDKDGEEIYQFLIPFSKAFQLTQRFGNVMSSRVWEYAKLVEGKLEPIPMDVLPFQSEIGAETLKLMKERDKARTSIDKVLRGYKQNTLVYIGPNLIGDVGYANPDFFQDLYLYRTQLQTKVLSKRHLSEAQEYDAKEGVVKEAGGIGGIMQRLKTLQGKLLHGSRLGIALAQGMSVFGITTNEASIDNKALKEGRYKGGRITLNNVSISPEVVDKHKLRVELEYGIGRRVQTGDRSTVAIKAPYLFVKSDWFSNLFHKMFMNPAQGGAKGYLSQMLQIEGASDVGLVVTSAHIKTGDTMMQTGAYLITQMGAKGYLDKVMGMGSFDIKQALENIHNKMRNRDGGEPKKGTYLREVFDVLKSTDKLSALQRLMSEVDSSIISYDFTEGPQDYRRRGRVLKSSDHKHQAAAAMAWFLHEQFFTSEALKNIQLHKSGFFDKPMLAGSEAMRKASLMMAGKDEFTQDDFSYVVPVVPFTGIATNSVPLSSRPNTQILTYLNIGEGAATLYEALHPALNEKQMSFLHMASLFTYGHAAMPLGPGNRRYMDNVLPGQISAGTVAASATHATLEDTVTLTRAARNLTSALYSGIAEGKSYEDLLKQIDKAHEDISLIEAKKDKLKNLVKNTKGKTEAGQSKTLATKAIISALKQADVGALRIIVPKLEFEHAGFRHTAKLKGFHDILMPDAEALEQLSKIGGAEAASEIDHYIELLHLMGQETRTMQKIMGYYNTPSEDGFKFYVGPREYSQFNRLTDFANKINKFQSKIMGSDFLKHFYGNMVVEGNVGTVVSSPAVPLGTSVYGKLPYNQALATNTRAVMKDLTYTRAVDGRKRVNKLAFQTAMNNLGLGNEFANLIKKANSLSDIKDAPQLSVLKYDNIDFSRKSNIIRGHDELFRVHLTRDETSLMKEQSYSQVIDKLQKRNIDVTGLDLGTRDAVHRHELLVKSGVAIIDKALGTYGDFFKNQAKGSASLQGAEGIVIEHRRQQAYAKLSSWIQEGVKAKNFSYKVAQLASELVLSNPERMVTYGNRAGAPLGTSHLLNIILRPEEVNLINKHLGLDVPEFSVEHSEAMIGLNPTGMVEALGDFDGDQVTLQNVSRLNLLWSQKTSLERERKVAITQGKSFDEAKLNDINKSLEVIQGFLADNQNGKNLVHHAARYTGNMGLVEAFARAGADSAARDKVLAQSVAAISQARDQFEQVSDYLSEYVKEFDLQVKGYEEQSGKSFMQMTDREGLHKKAAEAATKQRVAKLEQSITDPLSNMKHDDIEFLYRYIGFAGTEVIGKAFNATYDLLLNTQFIAGKHEGSNKEAENRLFGRKAMDYERGLSQMDRISGFMQSINQMARDSLKPKAFEAKLFGRLRDKYRGEGARAAAKEVAGAETISYLTAILEGSTEVKDLIDGGTRRKETPGFLELSKTFKEFHAKAAIEQARFQIETTYTTKFALSGLIEDGLLIGEEVIKNIASEAGVSISSYEELKQNHDLRDQFITGLFKKNKKAERVLLDKLLIEHNYNSIGLMFSSQSSVKGFMTKRDGEHDLKGLVELFNFGAERAQYERDVKQSIEHGSTIIPSKPDVSISREAKVATLLSITARPHTQFSDLEGMTMIRDILENEDLQSKSMEQRQAFFDDLNRMDKFGTKIGTRFQELWEQGNGTILTKDQMAQTEEQRMKQTIGDIRRGAVRHREIAEWTAASERLAEQGLSGDQIKTILDRKTGASEAMLDLLSTSPAAGITLESGPIDKFLAKGEKTLSKFVNLESESGRASFGVVTNLFGGMLGAGIANAIMGHKSTGGELVQAGVVSSFMMNPTMAAKMNASGDSETLLKSTASLLAGGVLGQAAEVLTSRVIPKAHKGTAAVAGFLASTVLGAFGSVITESFFEAKKKAQRAMAGELGEAAVNAIEALFLPERDISDDPTQTAEYRDLEGNDINVVSDDGSEVSNWLDENGMGVIRGDLTNEFTV
jgi:hypothetical protein